MGTSMFTVADSKGRDFLELVQSPEAGDPQVINQIADAGKIGEPCGTAGWFHQISRFSQGAYDYFIPPMR